MRSGRVLSLAAILIWFYFFLAVVLNPTFDPSDVPNNPLMPFLSAATVALFWPPVLISTPIVLVAGQRLIKPSGPSQREISPQEFIRIQARAIRMSEADRRSARLPTPPSAAATPRAAPSGTVAERVEAPTARRIVEETAKPAAAVTRVSEFTPPPIAPPKTAPPPPISAPKTAAKESVTAEKTPATVQTKQELETAAHLGSVDRFKDIEELEAEKGAVASLVERLEEMNNTQSIKRKLYEKLKARYSDQIGKIDERIRELSESKKD